MAVYGDVFGDGEGNVRLAGGVSGADVTPGRLRDRVGADYGLGIALAVFGPLLTQCAVRGGVAAGFGEDVAPVAEAVSPRPERELFQFGQAA